MVRLSLVSILLPPPGTRAPVQEEREAVPPSPRPSQGTPQPHPKTGQKAKTSTKIPQRLTSGTAKQRQFDVLEMFRFNDNIFNSRKPLQGQTS